METNKNPKKSKPFEAYIKYSAIAFQMIVVIGVCTFIGYKIDENRNAKQPIFTAICSLLGVCIALYQVIRSVKKMQS